MTKELVRGMALSAVPPLVRIASECLELQAGWAHRAQSSQDGVTAENQQRYSFLL